MLSPIDIQLFRMYVRNKKANAGSVWSNQPAIVRHHDSNRTAAGVQITAVGKWPSFILYHRDFKVRFQPSRRPIKTADLNEQET